MIKIKRLVALICLCICLILAYIITQKTSKNLPIQEQIYGILHSYAITYDIDKQSVNSGIDTEVPLIKGVQECIDHIAYFTNKNQPIRMILVGFPFKSGNQEKKVIGNLPDMAERKSLEYLQKMLNAIKSVYDPGVSLLIFCDGMLFAEFFGIPINHVLEYEKALKKLAIDLPDITMFTSQDLMQKHSLTNASEIIAMIDQYEPTDQQFKTETKILPETALKRISVELDYAQGKEILKKNSLESIATKLLTREMRLRNYIAGAFGSPSFFRLTVHFTADISKKFGIKLSPTSEVTPYHGTMVEEKDGSWEIRFLKDIDASLYKLTGDYINGIECLYFKRI